MAVNPILLLPFKVQELGRKPGGGNVPNPLVAVTSTLMAQLSTRFNDLAAEAAARGASEQYPAPVRVVLRPSALAKSNRPYKLLGQAGLNVVAAEAPGEVIAAGTPGRLRLLATIVNRATAKRDLFDISTFQEVSLWGAGVPEESTNPSGDQLYEVTYFPWANGAMSISTQTLSELQGTGGVEQGLALRGSGTLDDVKAALDVNVVARVPSQLQLVEIVRCSWDSLIALSTVMGVRSINRAPEYEVISLAGSTQGEVSTALPPLNPPDSSTPIVGVLDSGVSSAVLAPWIVASERYDVPPALDTYHGTFVAGLVTNSAGFNAGGQSFPTEGARVLDAQVMPRGNVPVDLLLERIVEVVENYSDTVKVWNCSFASPTPESVPRYTALARELDALSDRLGILFVQAAGNYVPAGQSARAWPPTGLAGADDAICSPAEAVRSITVGALSHLGGFVPVGRPSSYSRRGPSFAHHIKPEITHWAGDVDSSGVLSGHGVRSIGTGDVVTEDIGTSFSTPIASSIAANAWSEVDSSGAVSRVTPELIKGLLAHSAALAADAPNKEFRHYTGWGRPDSASGLLQNFDNEFTTVHEVDIPQQGVWTKAPFPMPDSLLTVDGKFHGEVILTISYAPPVDPNFGAECVRYEVSGGFGFQFAVNGKLNYKSITEEDAPTPEPGRIADGKWSPLKTYRKKFPRGQAGGLAWALRLELLQRMQDEQSQSQRVYAIVTLRSIDPDVEVYQRGVAAVNALRIENKAMLSSARIRLGLSS